MTFDVHRDIDCSRLPGHSIHKCIHRRFVERIERSRLRHAPNGADFAGYLLQLGQGAAGQKHPGSLTGEGARHRSADCPAPAVDQRHLMLQ